MRDWYLDLDGEMDYSYLKENHIDYEEEKNYDDYSWLKDNID